MIQIQNLHKSFGTQEVLKGVDLEVQQGKVLVIIGPSGSGKTTLLRCLNLLETPTKGFSGSATSNWNLAKAVSRSQAKCWPCARRPGWCSRPITYFRI